MRPTDTHRETDRKTATETDTHRHTDTQTEAETQTDRLLGDTSNTDGLKPSVERGRPGGGGLHRAGAGFGAGAEEGRTKDPRRRLRAVLPLECQG